MAATRAITLERILEDNRQFRDNIDLGNGRLALSEDSLAGLNDLSNRARQILLRHTQSTFDAQTQALAAIEVDQIFQEAVSIANRKFGEEFLFAGQNVDERPFQTVGSFVTYTGNDVARTTRIASGTVAEVSITGVEAFGALTAQVLGDVDLDPNLAGSTKLADLNDGRGVGAHGAVAAW